MNRMTICKVLVFLTIMMTFAVPAITAQETDTTTNNGKKFGISVALQTEQLDITFPIWPGSSIVIIPSISIVSVSDVATDFGFGLGLRYNLNTTEAVPYIGIRFVALNLLPKNGDSITDLVFGLFSGGEYFFSDHFSLSVEAQLNYAKSDEFSTRFGNPDGTNVNTATVALATFYF
ncbi:MAG: hypothetical protein IIC66_02720 [candidate division Zixibacteria bacterium]|nr:hypothetical protein [candidate division Zixibacteria bacterium]